MDLALVGGVDAVDPAHSQARQVLAQALEAGVPCIEIGRGLNVAKQAAVLFGAPADRALELGLEGAALEQRQVDPGAALAVLEHPREAAVGGTRSCFLLEGGEEGGLRIVPPIPGDLDSPGRSAGALYQAMERAAGEGCPAYRVTRSRDLRMGRGQEPHVDRSDLTLPAGKPRVAQPQVAPWEEPALGAGPGI